MGVLLNTFFILFLFNFFQKGDVAINFRSLKANHEAKLLSKDEVMHIAKLSNMNHFEDLLSHILVPRVVGSDSHKKVKEFIVNELKGLKWAVELQESEQMTPFGKLKFANIIGRLNPSADRYLVLACHYDSKHMREGEFLGATDSAVPCAMMLDLAHRLNEQLELFRNSDLSLMLLFFDGEEAFVKWGPTDSIYGARSLAKKWVETKYPTQNSNFNNLDRMDLLVLLDLLGAPQPTFYNYFSNTQRWYMRLAAAEKRLTDMKQLKKRHNEVYFLQRHLNAHIEDDHIPFIKREVPCLHLIPTPFPDVWHTINDNRLAVDLDTIDNLSKILRMFTLEYLEGSPRQKRSPDYQYEDL